jgi:hypothetical protein
MRIKPATANRRWSRLAAVFWLPHGVSEPRGLRACRSLKSIWPSPPSDEYVKGRLMQEEHSATQLESSRP